MLLSFLIPLNFSRYECSTWHTHTECLQSTQGEQDFKYAMHDADDAEDASQCANDVYDVWRSQCFVPKISVGPTSGGGRAGRAGRACTIETPIAICKCKCQGASRRRTTFFIIFHFWNHSLSQVQGGKICVKLDVLQTCFKFCNVALVQQLQSEHFSHPRSPWTKNPFPTMWRNDAWSLRCIRRVFSDFYLKHISVARQLGCFPDFASKQNWKPNILILCINSWTHSSWISPKAHASRHWLCFHNFRRSGMSLCHAWACAGAAWNQVSWPVFFLFR